MPKRARGSDGPSRRVRRRVRGRRRARGFGTRVQKRMAGVAFPLGNRLFTRQTYNQIVTQAGAALATYTFRGSSLFDPDLTGGGNQPLGFDELSAFYQKYRVFASKIVAKYITKAAQPVRIIVKPSNVVTTPPTADAAASTGQAKVRDVMGSATAGRPTVITHFARTNRILGLSKVAIYDEDFAALTSASPTHGFYWQLTAHSLDGTTAVDGYWDVKITYYCEFFDRHNLAMS